MNVVHCGRRCGSPLPGAVDIALLVRRRQAGPGNRQADLHVGEAGGRDGSVRIVDFAAVFVRLIFAVVMVVVRS